MIWAEAVAQDRRVVEISWQEAKTEPFWFCPKDSSLPPSRFRVVCKEAEEVYLRDRIPLFPCVPTTLINDWIALHGRYFVFAVVSLPEPPWQHCPRLFFNPKVDIVYISHHSTLPRSNHNVATPSFGPQSEAAALTGVSLAFIRKVDEALSGRAHQMLDFPALEQLLVLKSNKG